MLLNNAVHRDGAQFGGSGGGGEGLGRVGW